MEILKHLEERERQLNEELEKIKVVKSYLFDLFSTKEAEEIEVNENSLKFDIYERIVIQPPHCPIHQIWQNKLTPHLNCIKKEDKYIIKGLLLLELHYLPEIHNNSLVFYHNLPVEISIPDDRIDDDAKIKYAVKNYKVEVVGKRAVNLTGVLEVQI